MVKVSLEVREGDIVSEVTVYADNISQAADIAEGRYPGCDVRVVFPIDGEEFFGGAATKPGGQPELLQGRVR